MSKIVPHEWEDLTDSEIKALVKKEMAELLKAEINIEKVAMEMVENAKNRGGHDNITVIIASRKGSINKRPPRDTEPG